MIYGQRRIRALAAAAIALIACVGGCGETSGPERYAVSGTVTYNGQPVPVGFVYFTPDAAQGNSGPEAGAPIRQGRYATEPDQSPVGGPHIVKIVGQDGVPIDSPEGRVEAGRALFPAFETQLELPHAATKHDFDVPAAK